MVRPMEEKDIEDCLNICNLNFKIEGYDYNTEKQLRSYLKLDQFIRPEYFVYEKSGIIKGMAGFSATGIDSGVFGLFMCHVHPDFQYLGVGKALTKKRIEVVKQRVGLTILATTRKVWHLERFGFKEITSPYLDWSMMQLIL